MGVKGPRIVGECGGDGRVQVLDLAENVADEVCGIRWDGGECFGAFGVHHLCTRLAMGM